MKLSRFCEERQVKQNTVNQYIKRHQSEFKGHITKKGNCTELDDEAVQLLNEIYPFRVVQIVHDEETERLLKKVTEHAIELQQRINSMSEEMIEIKAEKLMIEMKLNSQEEEITRLKSRNLISRILNK